MAYAHSVTQLLAPKTFPSPPNETHPQQSHSTAPPICFLPLGFSSGHFRPVRVPHCVASGAWLPIWNLQPALSHLVQPSTAGLLCCFPESAPVTGAALMPEFPLSWGHSWDSLGHMVALGPWTLSAGSCPVIPPGVGEGLGFSKSLSALTTASHCFSSLLCVHWHLSRVSLSHSKKPGGHRTLVVRCEVPVSLALEAGHQLARWPASLFHG